MTLRVKTLIMVALALLALLAVLFSTSRHILLRSFAEVERKATHENVQRALEALQTSLERMSISNGDWAGWNDTYDFVQTGNRDYYTNLTAEGVGGLSINLMVYVQPSGKVRYSTGFDSRKAVKVPLAPDVLQTLLAQRSLWQHHSIKSVTKGIVQFPNGPMLVISRPILTNDKKGPIRGALIFGHYLDEEQIQHIGEIARLPISLHALKNSSLLQDLQQGDAEPAPPVVTWSYETPIFIRPLNENTINGYALLKDIAGKPAFLLQISTPRDIYKTGQEEISHLIWLGLACGLFFGVLTLAMLERWVLSPLSYLGANLAYVRSRSMTADDALPEGALQDGAAPVEALPVEALPGEVLPSIPVTGRDELSQLARDINSTLGALALAQQKLRRAHFELEEQVAQRTAELRQSNSELLVANEEAQVARAEADAANQAKSEYLSRMSHELRTPLNAILGFAQILEQEELDALGQESVEHILKGGRHLLGLINEILDISRVESGYVGVSLEPVDVGEIISESLDMVYPLAAQHGIQMQWVSGLPAHLFVQADRQRLKQVLINLLSNAVKYNKQGGRVGVEVQERDNDKLSIQVHDTGIGITPESLKSLFTPFERLGAEKLGIEGTGLGLTLCKRLVEAMNGEITVDSTPGQGSTFAIELPSAACPVRHLESQMTHETHVNDVATVQDFKVLSIEDNASNYRLIEAIMAHRPGVKLMGAVQGSIGLDLARQHQPNLILLDLHLPDIMGWDVLRRLREDAATKEIPVVIISADATKSQIQRLMNDGANAYLTKPLNIKEMLSVLDETVLSSQFEDAPASANNATGDVNGKVDGGAPESQLASRLQ